MENNIDLKILQNFLDGNYSWNDYIRIRHWFDDPKAFSQLGIFMGDNWTRELGTSHEFPKNTHELFERVHYKILLQEKIDAEKKNLWKTYRQVAAILLIPVVLISVFFYLFSWQSRMKKEEVFAEIVAPEGARVNFSLPDGSRGWLNSGARLKYPVNGKKNRIAELTGEAYFEVNHLEGSDFVVSVPDFDIRVEGTKFNLAAYPGDDYSVLVLKEGKVVIQSRSGRFSRTMLPGEKMIYDRTSGKTKIQKVDPDLYTAWKEGYLIFDNEQLGQMIGKLERWYNADFTVQDGVLKRYRFKATFRDEPLEEVLRLLALTTPLKYTVEKREPNHAGVFDKKKVTLQLK